MKELYVNGKLTLVIYDNDTQVATSEEDFEDITDYLQFTIQTNIEYDAVNYNNSIRWSEKWK